MGINKLIIMTKFIAVSAIASNDGYSDNILRITRSINVPVPEQRYRDYTWSAISCNNNLRLTGDYMVCVVCMPD